MFSDKIGHIQGGMQSIRDLLSEAKDINVKQNININVKQKLIRFFFSVTDLL